ncbi:hypothetical protein HK104_009675 [Borealophlyctis nickersoniae]|nr:hypothetical protein HK104_009675 [Borealophlyctis nickersoniae]
MPIIQYAIDSTGEPPAAFEESVKNYFLAHGLKCVKSESGEKLLFLVLGTAKDIATFDTSLHPPPYTGLKRGL